jgi:uncharacterized protein YbbC (DUF1343 family)/CubicO group peptidase (beta-lactamase class C family)
MRTVIGFSLCLCVSAIVFATVAHGQGLPLASPQSVGMSADKLNQIDALVQQDIAAKKLPGAVVLVGHKGKIVFRKAYGNRSLVPDVEPMTVDTIFDLASLTKVVATTTSIMILVEQGKLRLADTIGKYIPEIQDDQVKRVTIQQLMTHVSGFAPDFDLREKWTGREGMLQALYKEKLRTPPGVKFVYSDINYIVLGEILGRVAENLKYFSEKTFQQIGMKQTGFILHTLAEQQSNYSNTTLNALNPFIEHDDRIAPTENIRGQSSYLGSTFEGADKTGDKILRGQVHDPTSYRMGGVAGHAGLFSTADDLARFCQMLLNGGILDGKRIMSAATVARMTAPIVVSESGDTRALGWDINTAFSSNRGELFPLGSFGHTGFTGTSIWIDRVSQTFVIFLSNRVHPDGKGDVTPLRAKIATVVASAIEDTPVEMTRLAEDIYSSQVAAQIPKFKENALRAQIETLPIRGGPGSAVSSQPNSAIRNPQSAIVLNGIDVLERDNFKPLAGMKIGLVTNQTGRDLKGNSTIDILKNAPDVKLVALFSPEHGIRGQADEKVSDSVDEKTGLPIYSLYGESRRPKPEQLKDLDALVYDIQDVGTRFYTYTATLRNVLEEAAKAGKPVFVLDRPDPINGDAVEGPLADGDKLSFIAAHTTPVRYGMTIGELGQMINAERKIGADLRVIKMDGWSRFMWFDETGQTWVNPSPNMRSLTEAELYPGVGLLETTNVSVGRGTDTPFELVGAPWIDGQKLAGYLNQRGLTGVRFVPVRFKPNTSVNKDLDCGGVNIIITDRRAFNSVRTGLEIAAALRRLYPDSWQVDKFDRLLVNADILNMIRQGAAAEDVDKAVNSKLTDFQKRRASFLLYK